MKNDYLEEISVELAKKWPDNRTVNIVCHGHSVPSGYFATPFVDTFKSYPHLLHKDIKEKFPFSVVNVIVSAIGGENSSGGAPRFDRDVLGHNPDLVTIDYGLNDRGLGVTASRKNLAGMIEKCLNRRIKVILLTPSLYESGFFQDEGWLKLKEQAEMIRGLAAEYKVGLADSFGAMLKFLENGGELSQILSHINHPNLRGHEMIAAELSKFFRAK